MKKIGMIFADQVTLNAAFYMQAYGVSVSESDVVVNTGRRTIKFKDVEWKYILIESKDDLNNISGLQFDAIFSEVVDSYCKHYIMSRFRPGLN